MLLRKEVNFIEVDIVSLNLFIAVMFFAIYAVIRSIGSSDIILPHCKSSIIFP